jgi:hypothetical protein
MGWLIKLVPAIVGLVIDLIRSSINKPKPCEKEKQKEVDK